MRRELAAMRRLLVDHMENPVSFPMPGSFRYEVDQVFICQDEPLHRDDGKRHFASTPRLANTNPPQMAMMTPAFLHRPSGDFNYVTRHGG